MVARADLLARYAVEARDAGCPYDQLRLFASAGYVAQPRQLEFHAAARACDAEDGPTMVAYGGARGPGKSHASLAQVTLDDCQRVGGLKALYLRSVGLASKEAFEDLYPRVVTIPHRYVGTRGRLEFPNGSRVLIGGFRHENDIDKYIGVEYDVIALEEATLMTKRKLDLLRGSLRTSKPGWRPRMYLTTNPGGVGHGWFRQMFVEPWRRSVQVATRFFPATVDDNRFIDGSYRRYLDSLQGWLHRAWRLGDWDIAAGQYFSNFEYERHVITPFVAPIDWEWWLAVDYGFVHPCVALLMVRDDEGRVYVVDEWVSRRVLVDANVTGILDMLARHSLQVSQLRVAVAGTDVFAQRGSGPTIAGQFSDAGLTLTAAKTDRIQGAAQVLSFLGGGETVQRLFIFERCARLIETLPTLQHDPHRPEDVLKVDVDDEGLGGDDAYDALRYGVMAMDERVTFSYFG